MGFSGRGTSHCDEIVSPHEPPSPMLRPLHGEGRDDTRQEGLIMAVPGSNALASAISGAVLEILRPRVGSTHKTRALVVERPAGNQVLHCLRVIAGARSVLVVQTVRRFDLRDVDLHA
jgi:hypothetical protein